MGYSNKACPIVLRKGVDGQQLILAFEHPQAGRQLVKGGIDPGESPEQAARRELGEEAGITDAVVTRDLGLFEIGPPKQRWHAFVCKTTGLPDSWTFHTEDGGGHDLRFFWHPIDETPNEEWHLIFRQALNEIRTRLD
jgi:8-oxo-dGTP pyrophosphatase MutT (NUDIX family)